MYLKQKPEKITAKQNSRQDALLSQKPAMITLSSKAKT